MQVRPVHILLGNGGRFSSHQEEIRFQVNKDSKTQNAGRFQHASGHIIWGQGPNWERIPPGGPPPLHSVGLNPLRPRIARIISNKPARASWIQVETPWIYLNDPFFKFENCTSQALAYAVRLVQKFYGGQRA